MARLEIRLTEAEKNQLQVMANTEGKSVTDLVKERLLGADGDLTEQVEQLDRRVGRLEELAGL